MFAPYYEVKVNFIVNLLCVRYNQGDGNAVSLNTEGIKMTTMPKWNKMLIEFGLVIYAKHILPNECMHSGCVVVVFFLEKAFHSCTLDHFERSANSLT